MQYATCVSKFFLSEHDTILMKQNIVVKPQDTEHRIISYGHRIKCDDLIVGSLKILKILVEVIKLSK